MFTIEDVDKLEGVSIPTEVHSDAEAGLLEPNIFAPMNSALVLAKACGVLVPPRTWGPVMRMAWSRACEAQQLPAVEVVTERSGRQHITVTLGHLDDPDRSRWIQAAKTILPGRCPWRRGNCSAMWTAVLPDDCDAFALAQAVI